MAAGVAEVIHKLVGSLGASRGREVARSGLVTVLLLLASAASPTTLHRLLVLSKVRVALLVEVWHEAVALADLVRSTTTLVGSTGVATLVLLVVGFWGWSMSRVALDWATEVVDIDIGGTPVSHVATVTIVAVTIIAVTIISATS